MCPPVSPDMMSPMIKLYFYIKALFDSRFMKWVANDGYFNYPLYFIFACLPAAMIIYFNNLYNDFDVVKAILFSLIFVATFVNIFKKYFNYFVFFNFFFWLLFLSFILLFNL